MEFVPEEIQRYSEDFTQSESELLQRINRETHLNVLKPRMLSGHLQGRLLSQISRMLRPNRILEIGTYTGYSAISLAEGLLPEGTLTTIDKNAELEGTVNKYVSEAGIENQVQLLIGNAIEIIPTIQETWDLVFIDADKANYLKYYDLVVDSVRPGGIIIADNVLWSGKVANESVSDKDTVKIREFNEAVHNDPRVMNVLLPVRDGLMLLTKL